MEKLTKIERLLLANQYEILAKVDQENQDTYFNYIKVLENEYCNEYYMLLERFEHEKIDHKIVWDTLDLYGNALCFFNRSSFETITKDDVFFQGFDGNEEIGYLNYAEFIIFDLHRFGELTENDRKDFNSHYSYLEKYRNQVKKWENMGKPYEFTEEQLIQIFR